jgi:hypothetical protein
MDIKIVDIGEVVSERNSLNRYIPKVTFLLAIFPRKLRKILVNSKEMFRMQAPIMRNIRPRRN